MRAGRLRFRSAFLIMLWDERAPLCNMQRGATGSAGDAKAVPGCGRARLGTQGQDWGQGSDSQGGTHQVKDLVHQKK